MEKQDTDAVVLARLMAALGTTSRRLARLMAALGTTPRGVEYDDQGYLIKLSLAGLGMIQLPAEIGRLTNLEYLDLSDNQLSQLPAEIGQLTSLQFLYLSSNQLSQLPVEIGQLTSLQTLRLEGNQLSQLPAEIGQLTSLQFLFLSSNQLSRLLPETGQLTSLQTLYLSGNQLSQLPAEIGQLARLQTLYLSGNQLSQLPAEIGQLTSLQELYVDGNQLSQLPAELGQLTGLEGLSLDRNQLSQLPAEIGQLTSLQELYLDGNQLSQLPAELGQLTGLEGLYLDGNQLSQLPTEIGQLTSLRTLNLHDNQLSQLPAEIGLLTGLQFLYLHDNQLSQLPTEMGLLTRLQILYLSDNQLSQLPAEMGLLTRLQILYLSDNQLSQLPAEIGQLTSLQSLNLYDNQLSQLPAEIGQLTSLQTLRLHNNQLSQLPAELWQLTRLQTLYLSGNQLSQLPAEIGQLTRLQSLDLDGNQLSQLPAELGQLTNLEFFTLAGNHSLLTPPPEIVAQGTQEILAFLQALQRASVKRYEAKLLLVGEGGTGKSSLLRALHGKAFTPLSSTHGIEVDTLSLPHPSLAEQSLVLNTWDFGGQDIYHATHQFFLTQRSLYLVVWNTVTGAVQGKLDFWLETIRVRAPHSPLLLVATHIDERPPDLNVQQYQKAYPQIVGVLSVSSKTGAGLGELKEVLAQQITALPLVGQPWPTSWVEVEQALLAGPEHHIAVEAYTQLCTSKGIDAEIAQGTLGSYLHDLGKVLFFRDDPLLSRMVVLKPNWITKAISCVLDDERVRAAQGILAHADFPRIWATDEDGRPYDRTLYPAFLRLMERFDLSYQIESPIPGQPPAYSLVPQMLPYQPPLNLPVWPPIITSGQVQIEMIYRFDFVPAGIMSWFIVRTHQYTQHLHWRDGVVLAYRGHSARVELFPMLRELRLTVWGIQPYTFFGILKATLDLILGRFEGLRVKQEVPCICHRQTQTATACPEVYRYEEDLVRRLERGKQTIQCPASYEEVSVLELLYGLHIGTAPQVMANIEEGQQEILRQLSAMQRHDELLLQQVMQLREWNVRNFTRLWNLEMHKMEAECPNTFFLIPGSRTMFNPKNWMSHDYKLYLMCQHPPGPHCVSDEYSYDLRPSREWWSKVAPWLKYLVSFLKFGVPMVHVLGDVVDAVDFKQVEAQLKLLEQITSDLPDLPENSEGEVMSPIERHLHTGQELSIGPALRFLHSFLREVDSRQFWGGLQKVVTPDGNILWLCSQHASPYVVQPLSLNP